MFQEERLNKILELLKERERLTTKDIVEEFGISRDTARRDIVKLTKEGSVTRTHGGITRINESRLRECYNMRIDDKVEEKKRIAKVALELIKPGQVCYFDASTTIYQLCTFVPNTIEAYSNSLNNVQAMDQRRCRVHIMGGTLNHNNKFVYGYETMEQISRIYYDVAFIGIDSLMEDGVYTIQSEDAIIKKLLSERSEKIYILTESSKFVTKGTYKCFELDKIDAIVTDEKPPQNVMEYLEKNNVEVIVA